MLIELVNGHKLWPGCTSADKILANVHKLCGFESETSTTDQESESSDQEDTNDSNSNDQEEKINENVLKSNKMQKNSWKYVKKTLMSDNTIWNHISKDLLDLIKQCLIIDPTKRPDPLELLEHCYFSNYWQKHQESHTWVKKPYLRSSLFPLDISEIDHEIENDLHSSTPQRKLRTKDKESPAELYHFWKLSGGNLHDLSEDLQVPPPIHRIPCIVRLRDHPPDK